MKKALSYICIEIACASSIWAMDQQSDEHKNTIRRIKSKENILSFSQNDRLELPKMSREDYMSMMEKFLSDNSKFLDYADWLQALKSRINLYQFPNDIAYKT